MDIYIYICSYVFDLNLDQRKEKQPYRQMLQTCQNMHLYHFLEEFVFWLLECFVEIGDFLTVEKNLHRATIKILKYVIHLAEKAESE